MTVIPAEPGNPERFVPKDGCLMLAWTPVFTPSPHDLRPGDLIGPWCVTGFVDLDGNIGVRNTASGEEGVANGQEIIEAFGPPCATMRCHSVDGVVVVNSTDVHPDGVPAE